MLELNPQPQKRRADWGLQNRVKVDNANSQAGENNALRMENLRRKLKTFFANAVYPQQIIVPRQKTTTKTGTFIVQVFKGRIVQGYQEDGVRVIVQENLENARFIVSPLFSSEADARAWATQDMGVA